jgi:alpha-N-arabinofuranosidase
VAAGDRYDSRVYTDVPVVDASATYDEETGRAALFVANRDLTESSTLDVDLRGLGVTAVLSASTLQAGEGQDRNTSNRTDHEAVRPQPFTDHALSDGRLQAMLPPLSWTVFEFAARQG